MIKFLQTTPSDNPDFPFQAGQIVDLPMSKRVQQWITDGFAVVIAPAREEKTVLGGPEETATETRPKSRGSR